MVDSHHHTFARENLWDAVRASGLAGLAGLSMITLQQWVMISTLVYTLLLIVQKAWQMKIPQTVWGWVKRKTT